MATVPIVNVAITEDNTRLCDALKNLIGHFPGMAVVVDAADGRDLLDKLSVASVLPDVVLLDINMPRMNGMTASALLAELYPSVRVIVFSFLGEDDKRVKAMMTNGCVGYLVKDALPEEIERVVRSEVMLRLAFGLVVLFRGFGWWFRVGLNIRKFGRLVIAIITVP